MYSPMRPNTKNSTPDYILAEYNSSKEYTHQCDQTQKTLHPTTYWLNTTALRNVLTNATKHKRLLYNSTQALIIIILFTSIPCLYSSLLPSSFIIITYLLTPDEDFLSKALVFHCSLRLGPSLLSQCVKFPSSN